MSGVARLWTWLSRARTRSVLGFLGAGLAAIVAAMWQVYVHFAPAPTQVQPPPQLQATTASASAPAAGAAVAGVERLQASQKRALDSEADALDNVTQQIEAAGAPPRSAPSAHR